MWYRPTEGSEPLTCLPTKMWCLISETPVLNSKIPDNLDDKGYHNGISTEEITYLIAAEIPWGLYVI